MHVPGTQGAFLLGRKVVTSTWMPQVSYVQLPPISRFNPELQRASDFEAQPHTVCVLAAGEALTGTS